jgi:hypothetical protein
MKFSNFSLLLLALTMTPFAQANSQGAPPNWAFGRVIPPANDTILKRDRQHPPAAIGFGFKIAPPANWIVTWTQDVQALGLRLAQEDPPTRPQTGSWLLHYRLDPCNVVGLDMPGTPIPVTYEFVFAASQGPLTPPLSIQGAWTPPPAKGKFTLTLDRDTVKPSITSLRTPTTVYRDQTIDFAVSATDVSEEMGGTLVWDSGLREFRLEGLSNPSQPGTQSSEEIYVADDSYPTSCDDKVKKTDHTFSYTVPHSAQPRQEIRLRAWVEDWATNKTYKEVVLKVVDPCVGSARWVGSIGGIHMTSGHQAKRTAESVRLCEGPLQPVGYLIKGLVHTIELRNDGSTITYVHSDTGDESCRISGQGTSPMMGGTVGEISSTLEEVGRNGELRWSQPTYWLSAATMGGYSYTVACHYSTGPDINTYTVGAGTWPINIGHDSYDPQSGNRKLEGGRMAGSYAAPDGTTASWSLSRQGGAPLFPANRTGLVIPVIE